MNYSRSLAHFLENRTSFLKNVSLDIVKSKSAGSEEKLANLLGQAVQKVDRNSSNSAPDFSIGLMMKCSMHLGHSKSRWNPQMSKYILGERGGIHIINLEKTLACLRQASTVAAEIARNSGRILFVGTSSTLQRLTYESATYCNQFYVNRRWIGGTISNSSHIIGFKTMPDLVIILDLKHNFVAAKECYEANIPVIAICDTDCDPRIITYPIPSNDESLPAIELVAKALALAAHQNAVKTKTMLKQ